ncbi:DUF4990 domain-containing protein [Pedobacter sp. P351]|uniref:right-handed parallel beta-helix repeat-containing protein n=1 Tax=Pedobacter superstes TaxID=3133441 RepID=UPI0030ACED43
MLKQIALLSFLTLITLSAFPLTYYVAVKGSDQNPGTIKQPFATVQKAQKLVKAGDTVYIRGGVYMMNESQIAKTQGIYSYVTDLSKSGTEKRRINYWAYPGEKPVFNYSNVKPSTRIIAFYVSGSYIHLKGFEVVGVQVTLLNHTQSECFEIRGSNNIYEQLSMHDGKAIGFYLLSGSNNLILNCDAYNNYDSTSESGRGGNSDGFGCHGKKGDVNNIFIGCRAWFNSDDGYDCINSFEPVIFENCWAIYNGYSTTFKSLADGNGFKAGGYGARAASDLPKPIPRNVVRFCLSVRNKANGFYSNHHISGSDWYNNTAAFNGINFNLLNRLPDNKTDVPGYVHKMRNNLGFMARNKEVDNLNTVESDVNHNYFNLQVKVDSKDFISVNEKELFRPRKADGNLPDVNFLLLTKNSDLIDAGIGIGYPFKGSSADLGYNEY